MIHHWPLASFISFASDVFLNSIVINIEKLIINSMILTSDVTSLKDTLMDI